MCSEEGKNCKVSQEMSTGSDHGRNQPRNDILGKARSGVLKQGTHGLTWERSTSGVVDEVNVFCRLSSQ